MRILVTGATGFLGSRFVEHIVEDSRISKIFATGRKFRSGNRVNHLKVEYVLGDLRELDFIKRLFENGIDVVINCASLSSPWGGKEMFYEANVVTQKNLIDESLRTSVSRFVYISSPSIYFDFKDGLGICEDSPLPKRMVNQYARTKWRAECILRESGLTHIILRPRALIGRGDTVIMPRLIRSYQEGRLRIMGSGDNVVDLTSVFNMVEAIKLSIFTQNYNDTYNISNGEPVKLWKSINSILVALDMKVIQKKIPYFFLYLIALFMELKSRVLGGHEPALTRYSVGVLAKSFTFDIRKAKEKLNYRARQTTTEAMQEFVEWYKSK